MTNAASIEPFTIAIPQADLDDLQARLAGARLPQLPDAGWELGVPRSALRTLVDHWQGDFDWRAQEAQLNELPHFLTEIDGQRIHFLHVQSRHAEATPLLLLHGWPGSFVEFLDLIEPLTDPESHGGTAADAFHLVIPSHPGTAFSTPLSSLGWGSERMATALLELMTRLGYERFAAQGGDTGAYVAPALGRQAPERVIGIHVNALVTYPIGAEGERDGLSEVEAARLAASEKANDGYLQIQAKSPHTLAYGLTDSPVGQLAWITDIFARMCDLPEDGLPQDAVGLDRFFTNVSLYWFTASGGSSAQVYYEDITANAWDADGGDWGADAADGADGTDANAWGADAADEADAWGDAAEWTPEAGTVPTAVLVSIPRDISIRRFAEREHHVVRWTELEEGGHFIALERPEALLADVREFFASLR